MHNKSNIFPIVEGKGEQKAAPVLIKRILRQHLGNYQTDVEDGYFLPRGQILNRPAELARAIALGYKKISRYGKGAVVVLIDSDDDDPSSLEQKIVKNVTSIEQKYPIFIIIFSKEYESMFIHDQDSIRLHERVRQSPQFAADPTVVRDAKGWFARHILNADDSYSEIIDQEVFSRAVEISKIEVPLKLHIYFSNIAKFCG